MYLFFRRHVSQQLASDPLASRVRLTRICTQVQALSRANMQQSFLGKAYIGYGCLPYNLPTDLLIVIILINFIVPPYFERAVEEVYEKKKNDNYKKSWKDRPKW